MNPLSRRGLAAAATVLPAALIGSARAQSSGTESALDRIQRTKVLRIAVLPGEAPYFGKDLATGEWHGACIDMATSIAKVFDAKLDTVESSYGNSVLDLQSNKIDLAFALNPTPQRALAINFTHAVLQHPIGALAKKGMEPKSWDDLNKPEVRIVVDLGSTHETAARFFAPKAQITALHSRDEATLFFQSGRADIYVIAAMLGLAIVAKNPALGPWYNLTNPTVALPSNCGVRREPDTRFLDVVNAWIDYNRGLGQIREYLLNGLTLSGVKRDDVPSGLTF